MKIQKFVILFVWFSVVVGTAVSASYAWAIDKEACKKRFPEMYTGGWGVFMTTHPVASSTYWSQVSSSWGECSLLGIREQREMFIATNADSLMQDSALGGGEYVEATAYLSGCKDERTRKQFASVLQQNFEVIYFDGGRDTPTDQIGHRIDAVILSHPELRAMCKVTS